MPMAVILAGGKGTRLKPFTITIPKPLLPIGEIPIIEAVLRQLSEYGFKRVTISLGHMQHLFAATIGDGSRRGLEIEYVVEDEPLGTAGSLKMIEEPEEHMLVMNGDVLTTLDFGQLMEKHLESSSDATIAVNRRKVKIDYGVIESRDGDLLDRYIEKPEIQYDVSMGINIISRKALRFIPDHKYFDMPQLMQAIHENGGKVSLFRTDCYWQDIGRFEDYEKANADFMDDPSRFFRN